MLLVGWTQIPDGRCHLMECRLLMAKTLLTTAAYWCRNSRCLPTLALWLWLLKSQWLRYLWVDVSRVRSTLGSLISAKCPTRLCWIVPIDATCFCFLIVREIFLPRNDSLSKPSDIRRKSLRFSTTVLLSSHCSCSVVKYFFSPRGRLILSSLSSTL